MFQYRLKFDRWEIYEATVSIENNEMVFSNPILKSSKDTLITRNYDPFYTSTGFLYEDCFYEEDLWICSIKDQDQQEIYRSPDCKVSFPYTLNGGEHFLVESYFCGNGVNIITAATGNERKLLEFNLYDTVLFEIDNGFIAWGFDPERKCGRIWHSPVFVLTDAVLEHRFTEVTNSCSGYLKNLNTSRPSGRPFILKDRVIVPLMQNSEVYGKLVELYFFTLDPKNEAKIANTGMKIRLDGVSFDKFHHVDFNKNGKVLFDIGTYHFARLHGAQIEKQRNQQ
ncbi:hypothetical protein N9767_01290 [Planktomarina temperata]|nr:hypothetical protein [Planktomarina temperata]